jgi:hypothetical protein
LTRVNAAPAARATIAAMRGLRRPPYRQEAVMAKSGIAGGKTNKHKSTLKAHVKGQVTSSTPKTRGKPEATPPKGPR